MSDVEIPADLPEMIRDHLRRYLDSDGADGHMWDASPAGVDVVVPTPGKAEKPDGSIPAPAAGDLAPVLDDDALDRLIQATRPALNDQPRPDGHWPGTEGTLVADARGVASVC